MAVNFRVVRKFFVLGENRKRSLSRKACPEQRRRDAKLAKTDFSVFRTGRLCAFARDTPSVSLRRSRAASILLVFLILCGCLGEALEKQAEQIRQQEAEIARQRKELEALVAGQRLQDDKQKDCSRAFREYFDKAQSSADRDEAIALYREGLAICPEDDVAHYELGRALADAGRTEEAARSFQAALKINPAFADARRRLDALSKSR